VENDVVPEPRDREPGVAAVGYPTIGRPVAKEDWFLLWGPLGVMCGLLLVAVTILWRRLLAERGERDEEREVWRKEMAELAREHAAAFKAETEKAHQLTASVKDMAHSVLPRLQRRIVDE